MPYFFHPADLLMIPALLFALWAQAKVQGAYARYSRIATRSGLTGRDIAEEVLRNAGVNGVRIGVVPGEMTDHYNPATRELNLSEGVFLSNSVAALGIAAHEAGHAIQHARDYAPMQLRQLVYPISSIGSMAAFPLILLGVIFGPMGGAWLINLGIWMFSAAVLFTLITLPVEFDASRRAVLSLAQGGYLTDDELKGVRAVLRAAALTYVAAAAAAILQLLRLLLIFGGLGRSND